MQATELEQLSWPPFAPAMLKTETARVDPGNMGASLCPSPLWEGEELPPSSSNPHVVCPQAVWSAIWGDNCLFMFYTFYSYISPTLKWQKPNSMVSHYTASYKYVYSTKNTMEILFLPCHIRDNWLGFHRLVLNWQCTSVLGVLATGQRDQGGRACAKACK